MAVLRPEDLPQRMNDEADTFDVLDKRSCIEKMAGRENSKNDNISCKICLESSGAVNKSASTLLYFIRI